MEGKIPTGLVVRHLSMKQFLISDTPTYDWIRNGDSDTPISLHMCEKVIPTPLRVTEIMIQTYCDSNTLMYWR